MQNKYFRKNLNSENMTETTNNNKITLYHRR